MKRSSANRLLRLRGERLERPFAHLYETGVMRRVFLRGHENIRNPTGTIVVTFEGLPTRQLTPAGDTAYGIVNAWRGSSRR